MGLRSVCVAERDLDAQSCLVSGAADQLVKYRVRDAVLFVQPAMLMHNRVRIGGVYPAGSFVCLIFLFANIRNELKKTERKTAATTRPTCL